MGTPAQIVLGVLAVLSTGVTYSQIQQQKRALKEASIAAGTVNERPTPSGLTARLGYGYLMSEGVTAFAQAGRYTSSAAEEIAAGTPGIQGAITVDGGDHHKSKPTFLCQQIVNGIEGEDGIADIWLQTNDGFTSFKRSPVAGTMFLQTRPNGGRSSPAENFYLITNDQGERVPDPTRKQLRDSNTRFEGLSYTTMIIRRQLKNQVYVGVPQTQVFRRGQRVLSLAEGTGSEAPPESSRGFHYTIPEVVADYIIRHGGTVDWKSFREAYAYASRIVQGPDTEDVDENPELEAARQRFNEEHGTNYTVAQFQNFLQTAGAGTPFGLGFNPLAQSGITQNPFFGTQSALDALDLRRHEWCDELPEGTGFQDGLDALLAPWAGAKVYRGPEGHYIFKFPDATKTAAAQSVGTIDGDLLIGPVESTFPTDDEKINRMILGYTNINKSHAKDTVTVPTPNSELDKQIRTTRDQGKLLQRELNMPGVYNKYQATSAALTEVYLSGRPTRRFRTKPAGFNYLVGETVHVRDPITGLDEYVYLDSKQVDPQTLEVTFSGTQFVPIDYAWDITPFDRVNLAPPVPYVPPPIPTPDNVRLVLNPDGRYATLTFGLTGTPADAEGIVKFNIDTSRNSGATWAGRTSVGPDLREVELPIALSAETIKARIQTVVQTLSGAEDRSIFVESDDIFVAGIDISGGTGLPALTQFTYDTPDQTPDSRGEYAFFAGRDWETLADEATRPGYVTLDHEPSDGENIADYLNSVKIGDTHGLIRSPAEFILKRVIGVPNYRYQLIGTLPAGVTFDPVNRILRGVTDESGTYPLVLRITDEYGNVTNRNFSLTVNN